MDLSNKKIGVTGGGGFLGSHVITELINQGVKQENILAPSSKEVNLIDANQTFRFIEKVDVVIHLAADVGGILYNKKYPGDLMARNLQMGLNVINACKEFEVEKLVNTGTTCMFPAEASLPFKEEDIFTGYPAEVTAPYGISKIMLFELSKAYKTQFGLNSINLIPVNLYGPNDHFEGENTHVVPALIKRVLDAKTRGLKQIEVWGTGVATREFLYAPDAAKGIVNALLNYNDTAPINLGTGKETSIKELVELIKRIIGFDGEIVWDTSKPDGTLRRCVNVEKAKYAFKFSALTDLEEGLRQTVSWYVEKI